MNCSDPEVIEALSAVPEVKKTKRIRPLGDRVLVRVIKEEDVAINGVFRPEVAQERPQEGIVVAVGKGRLQADGSRIAVDAVEGQKILFGKYCGNEVEIDGEKLLLLQENELQGVEEEF